MTKVVFFGNERLATGVSTTAPTLRALAAAGYEVVAVIANNEAATSRKARRLEIAEAAESLGIPVMLPNKPADILDELQALQADIAVLIAYGRIVPQNVIDLFPKGIINIHPSALPKHRGPTPIESVMLTGESSTAVSVMQLVSAMDAGPVYASKEVTLTGTESKQTLADTLLTIGGELLIDVLPGILNGTVTPTPQMESEATYDVRIKKEDGALDWTKTAVELERHVRAYSGWPKSTATLGGLYTVITEVALCDETTTSLLDNNAALGSPLIHAKQLFVRCQDGFLQIIRLQPAGKAEMDATSFINGYGAVLGS